MHTTNFKNILPLMGLLLTFCGPISPDETTTGEIDVSMTNRGTGYKTVDLPISGELTTFADTNSGPLCQDKMGNPTECCLNTDYGITMSCQSF